MGVAQFVKRQKMNETVAKFVKSQKTCNNSDIGDDTVTGDTHHTWINDRLDPMYARADSDYSHSKGAEIDQLLIEHHPYALKRRVFVKFNGSAGPMEVSATSDVMPLSVDSML